MRTDTARLIAKPTMPMGLISGLAAAFATDHDVAGFDDVLLTLDPVPTGPDNRMKEIPR